jgi:hypothetical protein
MKNIIFICCLIAFSFLAEKISAQAPPQKMTYQFVARNAQNQLIQNNAVGLRISILQGAPNGNAVYVETHTPQTNGNGTATIEVGGGTPVSGVFANIDWSTGVYFIQTEMDPQGQQGYSVSAVSQLLTVPYAFYAARSTRATFADSVVGGMNETDPNFTASVAAGITPADTARWNQDLVDDADNNPTNELQTLTAAGNTISLSNGGGSVTLTERDSIFAASVASGITTADTTRWNNGGNDWKLSGNSGTDSLNFIGTIDSVDFVVKTNNMERMRVTSNGSIGIGVTPIEKLDVLGGLRLTNGISNFVFKIDTGTLLNPLLNLNTHSGGLIRSPIFGQMILQIRGNHFDDGLMVVTDKNLDGTPDDVPFKVLSNGNVGIGNYLPSQKFHINNDIIGSDSSFVVTNDGKVGIGTINPIFKITSVDDDLGITKPFGITDESNNPRFSIDLEGDTSTAYTNIRFDAFPLNNSEQAQFRFFRNTNTTGQKSVVFFRGNNSTQQSAQIGIDGLNSYFQLQGGNLGIGTASPLSKFHISNDIVGSDSSFVVTEGGNVGIGTSNPTNGLHVINKFIYNTNALNSTSVKIGDGGLDLFRDGFINGFIDFKNIESEDFDFRIYQNLNYDGGNGAIVIRNLAGDDILVAQNSKKVGIGTNVPDQTLSVNGNASKAGGGSWATFSDRRVKQDIKPFNDGMAVLKQLQPVTYKYNEKSGYTDLNKTFVGFIAQDVEKVAPYMVNLYDDSKGPSGLADKRQFDESALSKIMLNAIKEQQTTIESQQKTIDELIKRIEKLEQK